MADVRQALLALRQGWFDRMTPDEPFLFSRPILANAQRSITFAEFGCIFDYGQHVKRHNRFARG